MLQELFWRVQDVMDELDGFCFNDGDVFCESPGGRKRGEVLDQEFAVDSPFCGVSFEPRRNISRSWALSEGLVHLQDTVSLVKQDILLSVRSSRIYRTTLIE